MTPVTVAGIDKRILKEEYRNHDLIARFWNGAYRGKIWKNNKCLYMAEGEALDTILQSLRGEVDKCIEDKRTHRGYSEPGQEEVIAALLVILPKLTSAQLNMLASHADAKGLALSLEELQEVGNYSSTTQAMLAYADIGNRLLDEIGCAPITRHNQDPAIAILIESTVSDAETNVDRWKLKAMIASALKEIDL